MANSLGDFEPIFGKANAEWENPSSLVLLPFMFHVHAFDAASIRIHVTDFHSYTYESIRSISQLEDLKDDIGIGGNWSDFMNYLQSSMRSDQVKLILDGSINRDSPNVKFIAQKSKGMPVISIALVRLVNSSASDAMANLSIGIFTAFEREHNLVIKEQRQACQLTTRLSAEQEKNESIQKQLDAVLDAKRRKVQKSSSDPLRNLDSVSPSEMISPAASYLNPTLQYQDARLGYDVEMLDALRRVINRMEPDTIRAAAAVDEIKIFREGSQGFADRLAIHSRDKTKPDAEKPSVKDSLSTKVSQRVVPAYRRAKVRGVFLQDSDDEKDN